MSRLRLPARPVAPPPLRDLSACAAHLHNAYLRERWALAVEWLRTSGVTSKWLLDKQVGAEMIDALFAAARKRLHAAIDYRYSMAVRGTAYLGSYHRRCLGQRYRRGTLGSK